MFGKIRYISDGAVALEFNKENSNVANLMNLYIVFESESVRLLAEVKSIDEELLHAQLLGEFDGNKFIVGTIKKPSLNSNVRIINNEELDIIMGSNSPSSLYIGKSPLYENRNVYTNLNDLFSNHFAIFGNSGSGKSCSVSRLIQNIFLNQNYVFYNANMFIFDAYGEYKNAFKSLNQINPNYDYKFITTHPTESEDMLLQIPPYLFTNDDFALLLNADNHGQLTIIDRMIKLTKIFSQNTDDVRKLKNHYIVKAMQSIIFSNQSTSGKKNDIFKILSTCHTEDVNMNTTIQGIGYTRRLTDCFKIDSKGEFAESVLINEFIANHLNDELESKIEIPKNTYYSIYDLLNALEFTLIGDGFLNNNLMQDHAVILRVRLNSIVNSKTVSFFDVKQYMNLEQYISSLILKGNKRCQIININLEDIDDNLARVIVKILSRMIFDFSKSRKDRASIPFHLVIEEAHRYIINDNDKYLLGYSIFERICKEGRKYGVIMNLISQRPVDISETVVSQMSNFLILKMTHPKDLEYIEEMLPNVSTDIVNKLNSLQTGTLISFGGAFKIPLIIKMDLPNPLPYSSNCNVLERWKGNAN